MEKKLKIIMVPYPAQGHVTPMLKLAPLLLSCGRYQIIIVIPEFVHRRVIGKLVEPPAGGSDRDGQYHGAEKDVVFLPISDGMKESGPHDFFSTEAAMENHMPTHFEHLLRELNGDDHQVACVVVDLLASYAIDVSRRCGVPTAGFWPAMLATYSLISSIPDSLRRGIISEYGIPHIEGPISFRQDLPPIDAKDVPWLIGNSAAIESRFKFWKRTLKRAKSLKWLLVNTFPDELHQPQQDVNQDDQKLQETSSNRSSNTGAYDFGFSSTPTPMILPVRLLRKHEQTASLISLSFWEEDRECLDWINDQDPNSVVYVSFGSWVSPIAETKVRNLALALEASKRLFVWVLKPEWRNGLPAGYIERVTASKQGKVVAWAPQVDVLHHNAVGCFLTHCGWNSTLEAIQAGKCLLCYPVAGDQGLNCEYIVKVWKIGAKVNGFGFKEVEDGIKSVMEDGGEMKERLLKLRDKVMGKDASSKLMTGLLSFISDVQNTNHSSA